MIKVLIVDDHISICDLFKSAFDKEEDFEVICDLSDAKMAGRYCTMKKPDLILMDICAQGKALGLDAAKEIREKFPDIKIILMSGFDEISFIPRAKEIGVEAFIYKSNSLEFFMDIARRVMQGESYFPEAKTISLMERNVDFTEKEMLVLRLLCKCKSRKDIAQELFISENTVKYHISNMLSKTNLSNAAELAIHTISEGWINPGY